jgi:hypothetical protein
METIALTRITRISLVNEMFQPEDCNYCNRR